MKLNKGYVLVPGSGLAVSSYGFLDNESQKETSITYAREMVLPGASEHQERREAARYRKEALLQYDKYSSIVEHLGSQTPSQMLRVRNELIFWKQEYEWAAYIKS